MVTDMLLAVIGKHRRNGKSDADIVKLLAGKFNRQTVEKAFEMLKEAPKPAPVPEDRPAEDLLPTKKSKKKE
jgi:hypothetical protein